MNQPAAGEDKRETSSVTGQLPFVRSTLSTGLNLQEDVSENKREDRSLGAWPPKKQPMPSRSNGDSVSGDLSRVSGPILSSLGMHSFLKTRRPVNRSTGKRFGRWLVVRSTVSCGRTNRSVSQTIGTETGTKRFSREAETESGWTIELTRVTSVVYVQTVQHVTR